MCIFRSLSSSFRTEQSLYLGTDLRRRVRRLSKEEELCSIRLWYSNGLRIENRQRVLLLPTRTYMRRQGTHVY